MWVHGQSSTGRNPPRALDVRGPLGAPVEQPVKATLYRGPPRTYLLKNIARHEERGEYARERRSIAIVLSDWDTKPTDRTTTTLETP